MSHTHSMTLRRRHALLILIHRLAPSVSSSPISNSLSRINGIWPLSSRLVRARLISASYVGAAGRRSIALGRNFNPNPNFQQVFIVTNDATSDYHALQLQFQRRLSKRFQALAAYTWSHSIDINSNDSFTNVPSGKVDPIPGSWSVRF